MPAAAQEADDEAADTRPIPRRVNFTVSRRRWWKPRTNFGKILLGTCMFIVVAGLVTLGILVRHFLTRDPHFRVPGAASIQSSGLSEVNRADILPVFGADIGRNIFFVPLHERRKQLESIPWVQQATVMRFLPNRLSVNIIERTPVAFVRQGQKVELADADGVILSMPPSMMAQHHYSFPVVTGINAKDPPSVRRARMAVYQRFVAELDQYDRHLSGQISEIDLSDPEDLRAMMPEQGADILAHFGESQFLARLQTYKSHIAQWRQSYPKLIGVDLRYTDEIPLEMSSDSGDSATAINSKPTAAASTKATPPHKASAEKSKATKPKATHDKAAHVAHAVPPMRQGQ
jgi:cell division protein FtsQ